jgi:hypothetical protein
LADELRNTLGVESKLVPGPHGIFDVVIDGQTVFSRFTERRLPEPGEVSRNLK